MCNTQSPKKQWEVSGLLQAFANLILVVQGGKRNAALPVKQVCSLRLDHQNLPPSAVTSERFWIEAQLHRCKALHKLPQQAYPYPKKSKILKHAVQSICFNHIIWWIVREEKSSLPTPSYCRSMNTKKRNSPRSWFLAQCAPSLWNAQKN